MTITASDNLLEAEAKVVIFIRDVNDLPPVFSNTTYEAFIFEEDPQVMKIMKVSKFWETQILQAIFSKVEELWMELIYRSLRGPDGRGQRLVRSMIKCVVVWHDILWDLQ